jgi:hypothetical protein
MKRMLSTLVATIAVLAALVVSNASASGMTEVRTTYVSGSVGPMLVVNWTNICRATEFSTVSTTVGRTPAPQYANVTQHIGAYFDLFRWNGSAWALTRQVWSGWQEAIGGYHVFTPTTFEDLAPGYYHLDIDYYWAADGAVIGRAYDNFFGTIYAKYTGIDDIGAGGNNIGGYAPVQASYCFVG